MVVSKWTPRSEEDKQEEEAIPCGCICVDFLYTCTLGKVLALSQAQLGSRSNCIQRPLPAQILKLQKYLRRWMSPKLCLKRSTFQKNRKEFMVDFQFPWLPTRCRFCDKWGHTEEVCVLKKKDTEKRVTAENTESEVVRDLTVSQQEIGLWRKLG